jgi:ribosome-associated protein
MEPITFELKGEFIELNQLLKATGLCHSGGAGKMLVAQGLVTVDGKVELRKTCKIRVGQVVQYQDQEIQVAG